MKEPLDRTPLDALLEVKKLLEESDPMMIKGICVCVLYEPGSLELMEKAEAAGHRVSNYYVGGGLNTTDTLGILEFTKMRIFTDIMKERDDEQ